jgi:hypothetical protein
MKTSIATEILKQLGANKFIAMTGVKHLADGRDYIQMQLASNISKAKYLIIRLTEKDLYTMEFSKFDKELNKKVVAFYDNVYADMLRKIYTSVTGQLTSL